MEPPLEIYPQMSGQWQGSGISLFITGQTLSVRGIIILGAKHSCDPKKPPELSEETLVLVLIKI